MPGVSPSRMIRRAAGEGWTETRALAVVFGVVSVPWTYAFVAVIHLPLWPSFVAAATGFAAGGGRRGFTLGLAGNLAGVVYAMATLALVHGYLGGGPVALALLVGAFMFLASLHPSIQPVSFAPAAFFGYAALFGVHAAGATALDVGGLPGEALATAIPMAVGSAIGFAADGMSRALA